MIIAYLTLISQKLKFDENFVGNILKKDEWLFLVSQFKSYQEIQIKYSELFIPKIHQMVRGQKTTKKMFIMDEIWHLIQNGNTNCGTRSVSNILILKISIFILKINPGYRSDILRYIILNKYKGYM